MNNLDRKKLQFPSQIYQQIAELVENYFSKFSQVDTILLVNSCARGVATTESDIDFAILINPDVNSDEMQKMEELWKSYLFDHPVFFLYKRTSQFANVHLDIINGEFHYPEWEQGAGPDYFEVEIGNRIVYSQPLGNKGTLFQELEKKWLPYYDEELRLRRLEFSRRNCYYDLDHIPDYTKRGLYFHAFDLLYKSFQEFLQTLFIKNKIYPIAYNKWIKEQIETWLGIPEIYPRLLSVLSINNIESNEVVIRSSILYNLLEQYC